VNSDWTLFVQYQEKAVSQCYISSVIVQKDEKRNLMEARQLDWGKGRFTTPHLVGQNNRRESPYEQQTRVVFESEPKDKRNKNILTVWDAFCLPCVNNNLRNVAQETIWVGN